MFLHIFSRCGLRKGYAVIKEWGSGGVGSKCAHEVRARFLDAFTFSHCA